MHANWHCPFPTAGSSLGVLAADAAGGDLRKSAPPSRTARRDRFDYKLIFAVSFLVLAWLGVLERCNPTFWLSPHDRGDPSLLDQAKRGAHHYATMAFQG